MQFSGSAGRRKRPIRVRGGAQEQQICEFAFHCPLFFTEKIINNVAMVTLRD